MKNELKIFLELFIVISTCYAQRGERLRTLPTNNFTIPGIAPTDTNFNNSKPIEYKIGKTIDNTPAIKNNLLGKDIRDLAGEPKNSDVACHIRYVDQSGYLEYRSPEFLTLDGCIIK